LTTDFEDFDIFKDEMIKYFKNNCENIFYKIKSNQNNVKEDIQIGIYKINIFIDYEYLKNKYNTLIKDINKFEF